MIYYLSLYKDSLMDMDMNLKKKSRVTSLYHGVIAVNKLENEHLENKIIFEFCLSSMILPNLYKTSLVATR